MSEDSGHSTTIEVPVSAHSAGEAQPELINVKGNMVVLTWITFFIFAAILYKIAWKPILRALDLREKSIRKALDDADKARTELAGSEERSRKLIAEAQSKGEEIVSSARQSASEVAASIEARARAEAKAIAEQAQKEIEGATEKARLSLRAETAELAIGIAGKIIGENMDSSRNKALVQKLLGEVEV